MVICCTKCKKIMKETEFYRSNNRDKYSNGYLDQCKKCATLLVDNWDPSTYLWILEEVDVPYIPQEWHSLLARYGRDPSRVTGLTIIGRYLSLMQVKQFRDFRWRDNQFIQDLQISKLRTSMETAGATPSEIAMAVAEASKLPASEGIFPDPKEQEGVPMPPTPPPFNIPPPKKSSKKEEEASPPPPPEPEVEEINPYFNTVDLTAEELGLTEEDVNYLRIKWGQGYKPEDWVSLEQFYSDMMNSFDIQTAGDRNTLILAAKASLKANQLLNLGDIEGATKATRMYDSLMKSGKWTAQQNKVNEAGEIDSFSALVELCEKEGFIPRYYTAGPQDKVDQVIADMQEYTRTLIVEEAHLGALVERAIKDLENEREKDKVDEEEIAIDEDEQAISDFLSERDIIEFNERAEELEDDDDELLRQLLDEGNVYGAQ